MINEVDICLIEWLKVQTIKSGLIQSLNCFHTQGGGIAKRIRDEFPSMYDADVKHGRRGDRTKMGDFCVAELLPDKFGFGVYGQYNFGYDKRYTSYDAICDGLTKVETYAVFNDIKQLGLPKNMGCTLGGGNWTIVRSIIETIFLQSPVELYICNYNA